MVLSSTISTLMGGTLASSRLAITELGCGEDAELDCFLRLPLVFWSSGVGFRVFLDRPNRPCTPTATGLTAAEGVGGAELSLLVGGASGAGGVGKGGGAGTAMPFGRCASEADESNRGRADAR